MKLCHGSKSVLFSWSTNCLLIICCVYYLGGSATSSPAMLGIREHRLSKRRAQSSMQLHNYYGDTNRNKNLYTGKFDVTVGLQTKTLHSSQ